MTRIASTIVALTGIALLAASTLPAQAQCAAPRNVSGMWSADDGGSYHLHVIGDTIWWVGMSSDDGQTWTNVFKGTRNGNIIDGQWADVRGDIWGHGRLQLRISGTTSMVRTGSSGSGFGGTHWGRPCDDVVLIPQ